MTTAEECADTAVSVVASANASVRSVTAFFPCYNDAHTIEALVRTVATRLERLVDDFEVVVVDDGSYDDSLQVLQRLEQELPRLRVVAHPVNRGYGAALRSGFAAATKEWIFYTDGDGQYDAGEVTRLVRAVEPGVDVAQGWKLKRADGRMRAIVGRAYHRFVAWLFGLTVRDTDCDFRLFRHSLVEQADLRSDSGAICVEMMYRFEHAGATFVETPVHHFPRAYGRSQFFRLHHLTRTFADLGRLWFRLRVRGDKGREVPNRADERVESRIRPASLSVAALAAIMLLSLGAHLWGLTRDLPMPDVDERYFVTPAAYMAASGDANPHWFGHPGSTVIYPLALAFRAREVVFHGAPLTGTAPSIAARFSSDPSSFYLMGRLWAMLFSLAALPLVFAIGRRVFGDLVGLLASALWALVPLAVQYGRITRTDSVALFFALATIWACLRILDRPSVARFATAGVAAGLGVASRYFLAALGVLLCVTWLLVRAERRRGDRPLDAISARPSTLAAAFAAMGATFVLTTPYFFLDWHDAMASLSAETATRIPSQSTGFLVNLGFYVTNAIPSAVSWLGLLAALVGITLVLVRPTPAKTLLLAWVPCVLVVISVLSLHWDRWVIPALPILALFAAYAVVTLARTVTARMRHPATRRWVFGVVAVGATTVIAVGPADALIAFDRIQGEPSTRVVAEAWIDHHIRRGSGVAVEIKGPDLTGSRYRYVSHFALASAGTVTDYARAGYRYLVVNARVAHQYRMRPQRYRAQAAFYDYLHDDARLLEDFHRDRAHGGPHLKLYDLGPSHAPSEIDRTTDARRDDLTLEYTYPNRVSAGGGPVPFARHALHRILALLVKARDAAGSTRATRGEHMHRP